MSAPRRWVSVVDEHAPPPVRSLLIARWRWLRAVYGGLSPEFARPAPDLERMEDGEPVRVACWQLPAEVRRWWGLSITDDPRVAVEPDDTVVVLAERRTGDTVRYYRPDGSEVQ